MGILGKRSVPLQQGCAPKAKGFAAKALEDVGVVGDKWKGGKVFVSVKLLEAKIVNAELEMFKPVFLAVNGGNPAAVRC